MTLMARIPVLDRSGTVADDAVVELWDSRELGDIGVSGPVPSAAECGGDKYWQRVGPALERPGDFVHYAIEPM